MTSFTRCVYHESVNSDANRRTLLLVASNYLFFASDQNVALGRAPGKLYSSKNSIIVYPSINPTSSMPSPTSSAIGNYPITRLRRSFSINRIVLGCNCFASYCGCPCCLGALNILGFWTQVNVIAIIIVRIAELTEIGVHTIAPDRNLPC